MGLLDSFMPGESYGIPAKKGLLDDKFDDPLFQIGLGILANNNTKNVGSAIGRGALQGMQGIRQGRQQKNDQQYRDFQLQKMQQEQAQSSREQQAIQNAIKNNPDMADAFAIDPKGAIKSLNPQLNQADPYKTLGYDQNGAFYFDNRSGEAKRINIDGQPVIKSTDSPLVRGGVKEAEARATAGYDINTSIPGVVSTDRQVAEQANPQLGMQPQIINGKRTISAQQMPTNNFSTPYPVTFGAPGSTSTDVNEGVTGENSIQLRNPANPNKQSSLGISVVRPEQQAALNEASKLKAEAEAKAQINLPNVIQESENTIKLVDDLVGSEGFKTAVGGSRMFGLQKVPGSAAYDFDNRLEQLKGKQFLQAYESLKGAGAITDIEGTKAGNAISRMNASTSEDEFKKAATEFKAIIKQGADRAKNKAGSGSILPSNSTMPKVRKFNPKTGKIE